MLTKRFLSMLMFLFAMSAMLFAAELPPDVMRVSEVKPGMTGYGLTVFKGTTIEKFQVTVLGVIPGMINGRSVVLVKMSGGPITERGANIMEGMSGSPVYINGKILGAIAYGGAFPKEAHAMISPLEDMIEAWDSSLPKEYTQNTPIEYALNHNLNIGGVDYGSVVYNSSNESNLSPNALAIHPVRLPIMASGLSLKNINRLNEQFQPYNMLVMQGPSQSASAVGSYEILPGCAVGMSLATGAVDLTAIGTLTYRNGNNILMFGHPFLQIGPLEAPLTYANILDIIPNYLSSYKLGVPGAFFGSSNQDRPFSVSGVIGNKPRMLPITVVVKDPVRKSTKTYKTEIIRHRLFSAMISGMVISESIMRECPVPGDLTADVNVKYDLDKLGSIERKDVYSSMSGIENEITRDIFMFLNTLYNNEFEPVNIKAIQCEVTLKNNLSIALIERAYSDKMLYKPGETVEIHTIVSQFRKDSIDYVGKLELPKSLAPGMYMVEIRGGASPSGQMGMGMMGGEGVIPTNLSQIVKQYVDNEKKSDLILKLNLNSPSFSINGNKMKNLSPTMIEAMMIPTKSLVMPSLSEVKTVVSTDIVPFGIMAIPITVYKKDPMGGGQAPTTGAPSGPGMGVAVGSLYQSGSDINVNDANSSNYAIHQLMNSWSKSLIPVLVNGDLADGEQAEDTESNSASDEAAVPSVTKPAQSIKTQTLEDFAKGTFSGTALTSKGAVVPGWAISNLAKIPGTIIWSLTSDNDDNIYAGTGHDGVIYKLTDGNAEELVKLPESEVTALTVDENGVIYAGASPGGKVYRVTEGKAELLAETNAEYVSKLIMVNGTIYAATGIPAKLIEINEDGNTETLLIANDNHITALTADSEGTLYAGTSDNGLVYKVVPGGADTIIYDSKDPAVYALACDYDGNLYIGSGTPGNLYRVNANGASEVIKEGFDTAIRALAKNGDSVIALTDTALYTILQDKTLVGTPFEEPVLGQCMTLTGEQDVVFANASQGLTLKASLPDNGTYTSPVLDASRVRAWNDIKWYGTFYCTSTAYVRTRSGNVNEPDSSWSEWTAPYDNSGADITSPARRYVQYQIQFESACMQGASMNSLTLNYQAQNQPPTLTVQTPLNGDDWYGKKTVQWSAQDPDNDTLEYFSFYSKDDGQTWEVINGTKTTNEETEVDNTDDSGSDETIDESSVDEDSSDVPSLQDMIDEINNNPDLTPDMKQQLIAKAKEIASEIGMGMNEPSGSSETPHTGSSRTTSLEWDTTTLEDGDYLVKIIATDRPSNSIDTKQAETIIPIRVINSVPAVTLKESSLVINSDLTVTVEGYATQTLTAISGVQFRVDTDEWVAAKPIDGLFNRSIESFLVETRKLTSGEHTLEVRAYNTAGNSTLATMTITIP